MQSGDATSQCQSRHFYRKSSEIGAPIKPSFSPPLWCCKWFRIKWSARSEVLCAERLCTHFRRQVRATQQRKYWEGQKEPRFTRLSAVWLKRAFSWRHSLGVSCLRSQRASRATRTKCVTPPGMRRRLILLLLIDFGSWLIWAEGNQPGSTNRSRQ